MHHTIQVNFESKPLFHNFDTRIIRGQYNAVFFDFAPDLFSGSSGVFFVGVVVGWCCGVLVL